MMLVRLVKAHLHIRVNLTTHVQRMVIMHGHGATMNGKMETGIIANYAWVKCILDNLFQLYFN